MALRITKSPTPELEDNIQMQIVTYCRHKKILMFAPINENTWGGVIRQTLIGLLGLVRGKTTASRIIAKIVAKYKRMGQMAGVTDLVVMLEGGVTLFVELKTKTGRLSEDQKNFGTELIKRGHFAYVCRSLDDFIEVIEQHEKINKEFTKTLDKP